MSPPQDLNSNVNSALAKMALADAQGLAIRKLLSRSAHENIFMPGLPLHPSHPSPAIIAKLHLECAALYSSALSLVKMASSGSMFKSKPSPESSIGGEVSTDLRRYLVDGAAFHAALGKKWLGIDAGEKGGTAKAGEAVGFLAWAKKELEELKGKGFGLGKDKDKKERIVEELQNVVAYWKHYKKVNDSLCFKPVPSQMDLQASIPAGRDVVTPKSYNPPIPAFGAGSADHSRHQIDASESLQDSNREDDPCLDQSLHSKASYAGAGAYY